MNLPIFRQGLLFLIAPVLIAGCGPRHTPPSVPESVSADLFILGDDASITGGVRISELFRSFVLELDRHIDMGEKSVVEHSREILDRLGLDPETHDISFYVSMDVSDDDVVPSMVLRAPIPETLLEKLAKEIDEFSRVDGPSDLESILDSEVPFFSISEDSTSFFVAQSSELRLVASGSEDHLAEMLARSHTTSPETPAGLFSMVGGADVWASATDIPSIVTELSPDNLPVEISRILTSIVEAGASLEIQDESALFSLYLKPKSEIEARDISDLVRGGIALLRMESEDQSLLLDFIERIRVSEYDGFSRVQFQISELDLEEWAEIAFMD